MTVEPTEEAARALDYGLDRSSLSLAGQLAYDRMVAAEKAYRAPGPTREENMRAELDAELARMGWSETTHTDLPVAQDGKQPQDALPGQPIARRPYLLTFCLICGIVGAVLGVGQNAGHHPNFGLVLLGMLSSGVPIVLVWDLKDKLGAVSQGILWTAVAFGVIGVLAGGASYGVYGG